MNCIDCGRTNGGQRAMRCRPCSNKSRAIPIEKRFWKNVNKTDTCWVWIGALRGRERNGKRYGAIGSGKRNVTAHRASYEMEYGKIPVGMCVLHNCDNPPCVRPDHLRLGTLRDNNIDAVIRKRQKCVRGDKHVLSKLTETDIPIIRSLYVPIKFPYAKIAAKFGVNLTTIASVIKGKTWNHIP